MATPPLVKERPFSELVEQALHQRGYDRYGCSTPLGELSREELMANLAHANNEMVELNDRIERLVQHTSHCGWPQTGR